MIEKNNAECCLDGGRALADTTVNSNEQRIQLLPCLLLQIMRQHAIR
jgi:hypothetical protein